MTPQVVTESLLPELSLTGLLSGLNEFYNLTRVPNDSLFDK